MSEVVCNYAVLRFLPYRETGEFVNIGVVVCSPETSAFEYRCETRHWQRVHAFFPECERSLYREAIHAAKAELERLRPTFQLGRSPNESELAALGSRFQELIRMREGLVHFAMPGVLLTHSIDEALDELYGDLVLRQFAQSREYQETIMRRRLGEFLRDWQLRQHYRSNRLVGDERFHITMPFVHETSGRVRKAFKPLDLDRREASDIFQHGDTWVSALRRLREFGHAPDSMVFPVRFAAGGEREVAAQRISDELREQGGILVPFEDTDRLRELAQVN